MKRLLVCMALAAICLAAQDAMLERLIVLKYADPQSLAKVLSIFGAHIVPNTELRALAIKVPESNKWPAIEEAIQRLDVPSAAAKNVEVTVYFVVASLKDAQPGSPAVPAEIEPVIEQLKKAFSFREYRMLDTLMVRIRAGNVAEASGSLAGQGRRVIADVKTGAKSGESTSLSNGAPIVTQVRMAVASVDPSGTVHINNLKAGMRVPTVMDNKGAYSYVETGINTDIDVKDGQKVVVGKSSFEGPDKAVFLVLTAKVL